MHIVRLITLLFPALASAAGPAVFAPGVVSTPAHEGPFAFTPAGDAIYFTRLAAGTTAPEFLVSHLREGRWSEPQRALFPEGAAPAPFSISPDGEKLFYTHLPDSTGRARLWVAERDGDGWKNGHALGGVFEKWDGDQTSPSVTRDGTLYFVSNRRPGRGGWDVYRSAMQDGKYAEPELLGAGPYARVSTPNHETSVTVSADGTLMVVASSDIRNGLGGSDLFLVELPGDARNGVWPQNLGPLVNSSANEEDPRLSADGKRLYFGRSGDIFEVDLEAARSVPAEAAGWKRRADMPGSRQWPQLAAANGRIYLYGGRDPVQQHRWVHQLDVYDPTSDKWETLGPGPEGWTQATLVSVGEALFLFRRGGPGVAEFQPQSKDWRIRPGATFTIGEAEPYKTRTVVLGRKAYTLWLGSEIRNFRYWVEYDFDTGVWTERRSMPFAGSQLAVWGGRIYAFCDDGNTLAYDPGADQWTELARMDMPRLESAVVTVGDEIWLIGGHGSHADELGDLTPTVMRFNPRHNRWSQGPALPRQRFSSAAAAADGRVFVMGGVQPGTRFSKAPLLEYDTRR
jgi:hypothetical protein